MNDIRVETSDILERRRNELAEALVQREFDRHPELEVRYGPVGREKSLQDAKYHLSFLSEAVGRESPPLFEDYVIWARDMLVARNVLVEDFAFHLEVLQGVLRDQLPYECAEVANRYITQGARQLLVAASPEASFVDASQPLGELASSYLRSLLASDRRTATKLIMDAVEQGTGVHDIYTHVFQPAQYEIGRLWQTNRISVAQEHLCTAATQLIMSQLYPQIFAAEPVHGALVATCVAGDLHEIGLRMVADFLQMDGWDTHYLGANVPTTDVVRTLADTGATRMAISATMTFHLGEVESLIAEVRKLPLGDEIRIMVGGYPFLLDPQLWKKVGADGCGRNAQESVNLVRHLQN